MLVLFLLPKKMNAKIEDLFTAPSIQTCRPEGQEQCTLAQHCSNRHVHCAKLDAGGCHQVAGPAQDTHINTHQSGTTQAT